MPKTLSTASSRRASTAMFVSGFPARTRFTKARESGGKVGGDSRNRQHRCGFSRC